MTLGKSESKTRRGRRLIWGLCLLPFLILVGFNLLLQTPAVKGKIEKKVTAAAGMPAESGLISYLPWRGFVLHGVRIQAPESASGLTDGQLLLEVDRIHAKVSPAALFSKTLRCPEIRLEKPRLTALRDDQGRLIVPFIRTRTVPPRPVAVASPPNVAPGPPVVTPEKPGMPNTIPAPAPGERPSPTVVSTPGSQPAPPKPKKPTFLPVVKGFQLDVGELVVAEGSLTLIGTEGDPVLTLDDYTVRCVFDGPGELSGTVTAPTAMLFGEPVARNLKATFAGTPERLKASGIEGEVLGGALGGEFEASLVSPGVPFGSLLTVTGANPADLVATLDEKIPPVEGEGSARLQLQGLARFPASIQGTIESVFENGRVSLEETDEKSALRSMVTAQGVSELAIDSAVFRAVFAQKQLEIDVAKLDSRFVTLRAAGGYGAEAGANVALRFYLGSGVRNIVEPKVAAWDEAQQITFEPLEHTDLAYHDVIIRGKAGAPRIDFWGDGQGLPLNAFLEKMEELWGIEPAFVALPETEAVVEEVVGTVDLDAVKKEEKSP